MAELDDIFSASGRTLALDLLGETVTYTVKPTQPGASASSSSISAIRKHLPDLSPATAKPWQRSRWEVSTGDVTAPKRGDTITDADGNVWTVFDVLKESGGTMGLFARIGQVRA